MAVSAKHIKWVEDFFKVTDAIWNYVEEKYNFNCYWNTSSSLTELHIIDDYDEEWLFDVTELSNLLKLDKSMIKHFFSVHCCVDNMYPKLVNQEHNTGWEAYKGKVFVEFFNPIEAHLNRSFGVNEIAELMDSTEHLGWEYKDLEAATASASATT